MLLTYMLTFKINAGFRLSATVDDRRCSTGRSNDSGKNYVTILFDRGKITSAHCSCELSTNWCAHVVATCLARIKDTKAMTIRMPVSDSLNSLDREQLLKFAQYLLCEHQNERVVETAQQLLDKLLLRQQGAQQEEINTVAGAPDPTAGPGKTFRQNFRCSGKLTVYFPLLTLLIPSSMLYNKKKKNLQCIERLGAYMFLLCAGSLQNVVNKILCFWKDMCIECIFFSPGIMISFFNKIK